MSGRDDRDGRDDDARRKATAGAVGRDWLSPPRNEVEAELARALLEARQQDPDEVALRRVWSQLSQNRELVPTHASRSAVRELRVRWPFVAAASLAGTAVAAVAFVTLSGPLGTRAGSTPAASATATAGLAAPGRPDLERSTLVAPATVRTASGEVLQLALRGGAEVTVTSDSTLVLDEDDRPTVSSGEVRFHVPTQVPGHHFTVRASRYRVSVVGTRFRVRVNGGNTAVGVDEGVVEVWNESARVARLGAGESWVSPPAEPDPAKTKTNAGARPPGAGDEAAVEAAPSASTVASAEVPARRSTASNHGSRIARGLRASLSPVVVSSSSAGSASDRNAPLPPAAPASIGSPSAGSAAERSLGSPPPSESRSAGAISPPSAARAPAAGNTGPTAGNAPPAASNAPPAASNTVSSADAALTTQARAARLAGEPRKALGLYRTLAQRGGAVAENAEYEIGRVLRDGLHQPHDAIAAWRTYRAQHPRGLLRVEADISVIETLVAVNDKPAALTEAQDFCRRFPDNERRGEIGALAGDLLRERGDFRAAVAEYDGALESGRCRRDLADAVSFHRAVSILHDDREAGVQRLKAYLDAFDAGRFRGTAQRLLKDQTKALAVQGASN